eukprot:Sro475_g150470.1 Endonuclease MutS2 (278) ;mRNA; r:47490-48323
MAEEQNNGDDDCNDIRSSLEVQLDAVVLLREETERIKDQTRRQQSAIIGLAKAYERQFALWEERLNQGYQRLLQEQPDEPLEVVGETLDHVRVVKKRIQSVAEKLRERGLRPTSEDDLAVGASVVIVAEESEWEGCTATIAAVLDSNSQIIVALPLLPATDATKPLNDNNVEKSMLSGSGGDQLRQSFRRDQLAVWDYASVWDDFEPEDYYKTPTVTKATATKRLGEVLGSIKKSSTPKNGKSSSPNNETGSNFKSARVRKQAKKSNKSQKKHKRSK